MFIANLAKMVGKNLKTAEIATKNAVAKGKEVYPDVKAKTINIVKETKEAFIAGYNQ